MCYTYFLRFFDSVNIIFLNSNLVDKVYPIGSIYMNVNNTDPSLLFGGEWERIAKGRTLIGVDESDTDFSSSQKTGGEKSHTLTSNEIPVHGHTWAADQLRVYFTTGTGNFLTFAPSGGTSVNNWTSNAGGGNAHNNLQPYLTCYIWERVA